MLSAMRERRKIKGWTQVDLSRKCGVSQQTIASIEREKTLPSILLAIDIARKLDTTVEAIWGEAVYRSRFVRNV